MRAGAAGRRLTDTKQCDLVSIYNQGCGSGSNPSCLAGSGFQERSDIMDPVLEKVKLVVEIMSDPRCFSGSDLDPAFTLRSDPYPSDLHPDPQPWTFKLLYFLCLKELLIHKKITSNSPYVRLYKH